MPKSKADPGWWQIASQPRYLVGLALAIVAATVFAVLANWQWSRTLTPIPAPPQQFETVPLAELIQPGGLLPVEFINRPVEFTAHIDFANTYIVSGRRQSVEGSEPVSGFWLVANSFPSRGTDPVKVDEGNLSSLTMAIYFSTELAILVELRSSIALLDETDSPPLNLSGVLVAPEGPRPLQSPALASLSLAQLVNLYSDETLPSYPAAVLLTASSSEHVTDHLVMRGVTVGAEVQPIRVRYLEEEFEVNWLTAFYAVEWLIFALIAFYIWWRLVSDARARAIAD